MVTIRKIYNRGFMDRYHNHCRADNAKIGREEVECGGKKSLEDALPSSMIECTISAVATDANANSQAGTSVEVATIAVALNQAAAVCQRIIHAQCDSE